MHFAFIIYGERRAVERSLRDMEAEKFVLKMTDKDGKQNGKGAIMEAQIRELPFGIKEFIFPKEYLNQVLSTIGKENNHYAGKIKQIFLRSLIGYSKIPEFKAENKFLWQLENTGIIPLGIKEDGIIFDEKIKEYHESI